MHHINSRYTVNAPIEQVWQCIDNFGAVDQWNPSVNESGIIGKLETGKGARRYCKLSDGNQVKEEIIRYQPGRSMRISIYEGSLPMKSAVASLGVKPTAENITEVVFDMQFQPKFGPLGWVMAQLMIKPMMRKLLKRAIAGMETHLKSGKPVGADGNALELTPQRG